MTTYDWHTEYARALNQFGGDTPSPTLEQDIIDAFAQDPQAVVNAITKIAKAYAAGKIHSPWGALKAEIPKQANRHLRVAGDTDHVIRRAEQWISNAGLHCPWNDAIAELQRRPKLSATLTPDIERRLHALWLEQQPVREQIEADELERAEAWKATRAAITTAP